MPAAINEQTRKQVVQQWLSGDSRDKIAIDNSIGEGTVSGIVKDWKKGLEDCEYESVRELAVQSKKQGIDLSDLASRFRLYNIIKKSGANEDQIESFISNCISGAGVEVLPPEKIIDLVNQIFNISKSESIALKQVPDYIQQELQVKQKLEEQIKDAEAVLFTGGIVPPLVEMPPAVFAWIFLVIFRYWRYRRFRRYFLYYYGGGVHDDDLSTAVISGRGGNPVYVNTNS